MGATAKAVLVPQTKCLPSHGKELKSSIDLAIYYPGGEFGSGGGDGGTNGGGGHGHGHGGVGVRGGGLVIVVVIIMVIGGSGDCGGDDRCFSVTGDFRNLNKNPLTDIDEMTCNECSDVSLGI